MVSHATTNWREDDSTFFIRYADIIVPARAEQIALLATLLPANVGDEFIAVDISCGAGLLSAAVLERYPRARVIAFDYSPTMLRQAAKNLAAFADRIEFHQFDYFEDQWLNDLPRTVRCFMSSLAIHHLDGNQKRALFARLAQRLEIGGAILLQDIVEPVSEKAREIYGLAWDAHVREQSVRLTGGLHAYEHFANGWNHFLTPDNTDTPSGLYEQLRWFEEAGLGRAECFWYWYGHAIYGAFNDPAE